MDVWISYKVYTLAGTDYVPIQIYFSELTVWQSDSLWALIEPECTVDVPDVHQSVITASILRH